jgi:hypothetical protein
MSLASIAASMVMVWGIVLGALAHDAMALDTDEFSAVQNRLQELQEKKNSLIRERDLLLFLKAMTASDSKYLLLNMTTRTGTLKYRNRVLRTISLRGELSSSSLPAAGMHRLTEKADGSARKRMLVFDRGMILKSSGKSGPGVSEKDVSLFRIGSKDMTALYYALEKDSAAYILP